MQQPTDQQQKSTLTPSDSVHDHFDAQQIEKYRKLFGENGIPTPIQNKILFDGLKQDAIKLIKALDLTDALSSYMILPKPSEHPDYEKALKVWRRKYRDSLSGDVNWMITAFRQAPFIVGEILSELSFDDLLQFIEKLDRLSNKLLHWKEFRFDEEDELNSRYCMMQMNFVGRSCIALLVFLGVSFLSLFFTGRVIEPRFSQSNHTAGEFATTISFFSPFILYLAFSCGRRIAAAQNQRELLDIASEEMYAARELLRHIEKLISKRENSNSHHQFSIHYLHKKPCQKEISMLNANDMIIINNPSSAHLEFYCVILSNQNKGKATDNKTLLKLHIQEASQLYTAADETIRKNTEAKAADSDITKALRQHYGIQAGLLEKFNQISRRQKKGGLKHHCNIHFYKYEVDPNKPNQIPLTPDEVDKLACGDAIVLKAPTTKRLRFAYKMLSNDFEKHENKLSVRTFYTPVRGHHLVLLEVDERNSLYLAAANTITTTDIEDKAEKAVGIALTQNFTVQSRLSEMIKQDIQERLLAEEKDCKFLIAFFEKDAAPKTMPKWFNKIKDWISERSAQKTLSNGRASTIRRFPPLDLFTFIESVMTKEAKSVVWGRNTSFPFERFKPPSDSDSDSNSDSDTDTALWTLKTRKGRKKFIDELPKHDFSYPPSSIRDWPFWDSQNKDSELKEVVTDASSSEDNSLNSDSSEINVRLIQTNPIRKLSLL